MKFNKIKKKIYMLEQIKNFLYKLLIQISIQDKIKK